MKHIILDFDGIKTLYELHNLFEETFTLPDYYGRNLDALWDCLHCYFESETTIHLKNIDALPSDMRKTTISMLQLFCDVEAENDEVTVIIDATDSVNISDYII